MVLGELIEEESGKITGQRVVDVEGPKIESSFTMNGKWMGQDVTDIGTLNPRMLQLCKGSPILRVTTLYHLARLSFTINPSIRNP
jgi:hypothetical protein